MLIILQWLKVYRDFKFDVHVPRDNPDMTPYKISEKEAWAESRDSLVKFNWSSMHSVTWATFSIVQWRI